jgi:Protein of unknown function (DUF2852)
MPLAALMILGGFWLWWPLGLAILALVILGHWLLWPLLFIALAIIIGSRHMGWQSGWQSGCWSHYGNHRWDNKLQRMQEKMDRVRAKMDGLRGGGRDFWGNPPSSGNRAFDDYRAETLKRLEDEQREFREFLDRLRFAKDKTEFDAFMAERRNRGPDAGPQAPQPQT